MHSTLLQKEPVGIGGWLVLIGLGLVISILSQLKDFVVSIVPTFLDGTFWALADPVSTWHHPALAGIMVFEAVGNFLLLALMVLALVLLLRTSWLFPRIYIALLVSSAIVVVADTLLLQSFAPPEFVTSAADSRLEIIRPIVTALIWIPYMLVSRRVRNTFIRHRDKDAGAEVAPRPLSAADPS